MRLLSNISRITRWAVALAGVALSPLALANIDNTATVAGSYDGAIIVSEPSSQSVPVGTTEGNLSLIKTVSAVEDTNASGTIDVGDTIKFEFNITNTGTLTLSNVAVTDPLASVEGEPVALLQPGESDNSFSASYILTQTDFDAGYVQNSALATADLPADGAETPRDPISDISDAGDDAVETADGVDAVDLDPTNDPTVYELTQAAALTTLKSVAHEDTNSDGVANAGDTLVYTYRVRNSGNVTVYDIAVAETGFVGAGETPTPSHVSGGADLDLGADAIDLAPGESAEFTARYIVLLEDVMNGFVENSATTAGHGPVDAANPDGQPISDVSDAAVDGDHEAIETPDGLGVSDGDATNDPTVFVFIATAPIANDDSATGQTGLPVTIDILGNDADAEGDIDPTSVMIVDAEGNRTTTLLVPGEGVWSVDPETGAITFTPEPSFIGDPTPISYKVTDLTGYTSNIASITIDYPDIIQSLELIKSVSGFDDTNRNLILGDAGDTIYYSFTITNTGDSAMRDVTVSDPLLGMADIPVASPNLLPGASTVLENLPYVITSANVSAGEVENSATTTGVPVRTVLIDGQITADFQVALTNPQTGLTYVADEVSDISDAGTEPLASVASGETDFIEITDPASIGTDRDPTILLLPIAQSAPLTISKTVLGDNGTVVLGESVNYQIEVENNLSFAAQDVTIVDMMPVGLVFTPGTAVLDGVAVIPALDGHRLSFDNVDIGAGQRLTITLSARVSADAPLGELTNTAFVTDVNGRVVSNTAEATVTRRAEVVFDCSDVIGKVFDDKNSNGIQDGPDSGNRVREPGIPHVRLSTATGTLITTDGNGRFHVPCAELPKEIGSNFILKLDTRSLPSGYRVTTENPRVIRLTAGKLARINFGASISQIVDVDLTAAAFDAEGRPNAELVQAIPGLLTQIKDKPSVLRISYYTNGENDDQANLRLDLIEDEIRDQWRRIGNYKLTIERTIKRVN